MHKSARLDFLDALRAIAALMVFTQHFAELQWPAFRHFSATWFQMGQAGVMLFFLVSGFIVPASLERAGSLSRFWVTRVCRLYPLYWLSLAIACALASFGLFGSHEPSAASIGPTYLANATMLQTFLGYPNVIGLYWTLGIEMTFYAMLSVVFAARAFGRTTRLLAYELLVTLGIAVLLCARLGLAVPGMALNACELSSMFLGMVVYRCYRGQQSLRSTMLAVAACMAVLTASLATNLNLVANPDGKGLDAFLPMGMAWLAAYILFGIGLAVRRSRMPGALVYLGRISFSLYLLQPFVLELIPVRSSSLLVQVAAYAVAVAALVGLASVTYRLVEQPGIELGKRLLGSSAKRGSETRAGRCARALRWPACGAAR